METLAVALVGYVDVALHVTLWGDQVGTLAVALVGYVDVALHVTHWTPSSLTFFTPAGGLR